ncbi:hypothetical protein CC77DRAFT_1018312 [Alternaria alternata]|uniref:Uncharacterized protein n=1 Tax=Alternaria alternata TaxID=5599 RepID=A0A177DWD4_ALTAL|nr:hypothetical protein CC77DRAFT_1018312 [Alternaria alternata]OAG23500.1 hypothetical protein CC77DRAFT_1018312 [Alternaria alternata]
MLDRRRDICTSGKSLRSTYLYALPSQPPAMHTLAHTRLRQSDQQPPRKRTQTAYHEQSRRSSQLQERGLYDAR